MSNRRGGMERSTSSNPATPDVRADALRSEATEARISQQEKLERALSSSIFKDPDVILSELCPKLGNKQDEIQASISRFLEEASTAEKNGDNNAWIQATRKIYQAQKDLSSMRTMLYHSAKNNPTEKHNQEFLDALNKVDALANDHQQTINKIKIQVNEEMLTSEHSTRLAEATTKQKDIVTRFDTIATENPTDHQLIIQIASDFKVADDELKLAQTAYDTASKEKTSHYLLEARKEFAQAKSELYNLENVCYQDLEKANLKDKIRSRLNGQDQYKENFGRDSERLASALLRKYPGDWELREKVQQIRTDSLNLSLIERDKLKKSDSTILEEDILNIEIEVLATKRKQLEWLSSQKWREMREEQLRLKDKPKASEKKK